MNKGFETEANHYSILRTRFNYCTAPKNASNGSDFIVACPERGLASFESKTSNTDIFELGTLSAFSNGMVFNASSHMTHAQIGALQDQINANHDRLQAYMTAVGVDEFPHTVEIARYNEVKRSGSLIHWRFQMSQCDILKTAMTKSYNAFVKANYLIVSDQIYRIDGLPDPLRLEEKGAGIVTDDDIDYVSIRTARGGSRNGKASVALRVQFRLKRVLPQTRLDIDRL